jgi:hypothetical protein
MPSLSGVSLDMSLSRRPVLETIAQEIDSCHQLLAARIAIRWWSKGFIGADRYEVRLPCDVTGVDAARHGARLDTEGVASRIIAEIYS